MACKDGVPAKIVGEVADLWFHACWTLNAARFWRPRRLKELERRERAPGWKELASRKAAQQRERTVS